jgi:hypothetical protein
MMKNPFIRLARDWEPDDDDPRGQDKRALLKHLLKNAKGREHAVSLSSVTKTVKFSRHYTKESLQQTLIVPLRSEGKVFVGTSNKGIQLADMLAGVIKNRAAGSFDLLHLVDDKAVQIRVWPPA